MGDAFEAIAQAMCEIISGIYLPRIFRTKMWCLILGYPVSGKIPHLRIVAFDILLHAEEGRLRFILSVSHGAEISQVCLDILTRMLATVSRPFFAIFASTLKFDCCFNAMTDVRSPQLYELHGKTIQLLKVIA